MKYIKHMISLGLCLLLLTACGGENTLTTDDLPQNQQEEIAQNEPEKEESQAPQDDEQTQDDSTVSDTCNHPQFLVAVDSQPVWSAVVDWYYTNNTSKACEICGEWGLNMLCNQLSFEDCIESLKNGDYDVILVPINDAMAAELEGYVIAPVMQDGIVFIRSNAEVCSGYDLADEKIRLAFTAEETVYWNDENTDPIIPASGWFDTEPSLWQHIEKLIGFATTSPNIICCSENCVADISESGRTGSGLWPCYFSSVGGDVGIGNGEMISINGIYPTETSIADGSYPYAFTYCAIYSPGNIYTTEIEAFLVELQKNIQENGSPELSSKSINDVSVFYHAYLDALQENYASGFEYVHFEDTWESEAYLANGRDRLLEYNILEGPTKINDSLFAIKCEFVTESTKTMGISSVAFNFVAVIDGQFWVITNVRNIPADLRDNFDESKYQYFDENIVSEDEIMMP